MLNIMSLLFLGFLLHGCFNAPLVSKGQVIKVSSAATTEATESKTVSSFDPNSSVATTITAPSGALTGSSITLAPGSLSIAVEVVVEEAVDLGKTSLTSSLGIESSTKVTPVGAGLIIRPTTSIDLTAPLTIAMPINPTLWASLFETKYYTVFYKYFINNELKAGVIPTSSLTLTSDGKAQFEGYFGAYWLAEVSIPIETKIEIKTDEPIVNKENVAVIESTGIVSEAVIVAKASIPLVKWAAVSLVLDDATRTVNLSANLTDSRSLSECKADFYELATDAQGTTLSSGSSLKQSYTVTSRRAHQLLGRFRCLDSEGRLTTSPWSTAVKLPLVNTAPTLSSFPDLTLVFNAQAGTQSFTVEDGESSASTLTLKASSSNQSLINDENLTFGGSAGSRTLTLAPKTNQSGTSTITITVSDGSLSSSQTFKLIVAANTAPILSAFSNVSLNFGSNSATQSFTVHDAETAAASLTVQAYSSDKTLLPDTAIALSGSGANRSVLVTPVSNLSGTTTVTVNVTDGLLTASQNFTVTVAANTAPTISAFSNQSVPQNTMPADQVFTIGDAETASTALTVTATSSNLTLLQSAAISLSGTGATRSIQLLPTPYQSGSTQVTVTVSDGHLSSFKVYTLTVAANTNPTISSISNQSIAYNTAPSTQNISVNDAETAAMNLILTGTSSNQTLLTNANIQFGGSGSSRLITLTPTSNQSGSSTITVTVSDGNLTANTAFTLTVASGNTAPTITGLTNQTVSYNSQPAVVSFTIDDIESNENTLAVTASSSNTTLVPSNQIVVGGSGSNRTLTVTPVSNQTGNATITVNVDDGELSTDDSYVLTISPMVCPTNYLFIPPNTDVGTDGFCSMKFEAKNMSGQPTSQPSSLPWTLIPRGTNSTESGSAWYACRNFGYGYDLMGNAQWQAIARNIENVAINWSTGSVGSGSVNRGNSDDATPFVANASDANGCDSITWNNPPNIACGGNWHYNKRTHTLSTGEIIWDIAGNVSEWVKDSEVSGGTDLWVSLLTSPPYDLLKWGPSGNHTALNSGEMGGFGVAQLNSTAGAVHRGGSTPGGSSTGIFASELYNGPNSSYAEIGFRCVKNARGMELQLPVSLPAPGIDLDADAIGGDTSSYIHHWRDFATSKIASIPGSQPRLLHASINGKNALQFLGNEYLEIAINDSPAAGSTAFTIAIVFKPNQTGTGNSSDAWYSNTGLVDAEEPGGTADWGLAWTGDNTVAAGIGGMDITTNSQVVSVGTPHVAIYSWDGTTGTVKISVDGQETSAATGTTNPRNFYRFLIGSVAGGNKFVGEIATVKVWNSAFDSSQINTLGYALGTAYGISTTYTP